VNARGQVPGSDGSVRLEAGTEVTDGHAAASRQATATQRYIAAYEIYIDGHPFWWGHLALRISADDPRQDDPQCLLEHLCSTAAQRHDVAVSQVRLTMVSRL